MQPLAPHVRFWTTVALLLLVVAGEEGLAQVRIAAPDRTTLQAIAPPAGPPPTDVRISTTPTSVRIRWNCPSGATGYEVYATPAGGTQMNLTPTPMPAQCLPEVTATINNDPRFPQPTSTTPIYSAYYQHDGLAVGAQLTYVVRALYPTGISDAPPITAQTPLWPAPTGVTVALSPTRSGIVQWNRVNGAAGYHIFRKLATETSFQPVIFLGATASSHNDGAYLAPGQHQYYVQTREGEPSAHVTLTAGPWPAPGGVTVDEQYLTTTVNWQFVRGATRYLVFRKRQDEPAFQQVHATTQNTNGWVDQSVIRGQTYHYYVQAVDGEPSAPVAYAAGKPRSVTVEAFRGNPVVRFSWSGATGANVGILRSTSLQGPFTPVIQATVDATRGSAQDPTATVGATQYYKLLFMYQAGAVESDVLTATIAAAPNGVVGLTAQALGGGAVRLSWACDHEASGYSIMRARDRESMDWVRAPGSTTPLVVRPGCEYTDQNLFVGSTYRFRVFGKYGYNEVAPNAEVSVRVR